MTDMVNVESASAVSNKFLGMDRPLFKVDETYWGYIVRGTDASSMSIIVAQAISMFLGAIFLTAAAGLMILPTELMLGGDAVIQTGVAVIFSAIAILFLWYASRGTAVELQVDTNRGELREVVRNRSGRTTLLGRYGFDAIGSVFLDRTSSDDTATLVVRYRNTAQTLYVAKGTEEGLIPLRNRMGRDLLLQ